MLINALNDYYDILKRAQSKDQTGIIKPYTLPSIGFSVQDVTHRIMLNKDGSIDSIEDIRIERREKIGKKEKVFHDSRYILLPERSQKPGIDLNIIEHRPLYIFGLNYDKKTEIFSPDDSTNKAKKSHECFVKGNLEFTEGMTSDIVIAYRNFLKGWDCAEQTENAELINLGKDYSGAYFCFGLAGHPEIMLHNMDGEIMTKIKSLSKGAAEETDGICAVSGKSDKISCTHDKIKGIRGGQSSGGLLVCFNSPAEESYGKKQSYNSPISETVMKRYTSALNSLIANPNHHIYIEDMTVVFWAMSEKDDNAACESFLSSFDNRREETDDRELNDIIKQAADNLIQGKKTDLSDLNIDANTVFYIVGLAPNVSRISQKFIYRDKFGKIFENTVLHQADMMIDGSKGQISLWRMCSELKSPKSKDEKIPPPLLSGIFHAILSGGKYPEPLLETVIRRVKTDKSINYVRAGIIKACLNRKIRINKRTEEFKMALDKECTNVGYVCGRLFAVLEKIQEDALGTEINSTIKDSYFASAASNPGAVFPRIVRLSQNHMKKLKSEKRGLYVNREKLTGEIMDKLGTSFPNTLTLNEQGEFCLGYYHQRQSFF